MLLTLSAYPKAFKVKILNCDYSKLKTLKSSNNDNHIGNKNNSRIRSCDLTVTKYVSLQHLNNFAKDQWTPFLAH